VAEIMAYGDPGSFKFNLSRNDLMRVLKKKSRAQNSFGQQPVKI
jgi:hypothetical protein